MSSVDDFLSQHPELNADDPELIANAEGIRLDVVIRGISDQFVTFTHLGAQYSVARARVLSIVAAEDGCPGGPGSATLTVERNAPLLASYAVTAADLGQALPFSLSLPPSAPPARIQPSEREAAWRRATRYAAYSEYPSLEMYLSPFGTATACDSRTGGGWDDTVTDDERTDY